MEEEGGGMRKRVEVGLGTCKVTRKAIRRVFTMSVTHQLHVVAPTGNGRELQSLSNRMTNSPWPYLASPLLNLMMYPTSTSTTTTISSSSSSPSATRQQVHLPSSE